MAYRYHFVEQEQKQQGAHPIDRAVGTKENPSVGEPPAVDDHLQKDLVAPAEHGIKDETQEIFLEKLAEPFSHGKGGYRGGDSRHSGSFPGQTQEAGPSQISFTILEKSWQVKARAISPEKVDDVLKPVVQYVKL